MKKIFRIVALSLLLSGCYAGMELDDSISNFQRTVLPTIQLGDSKQAVMQKLTPLHSAWYSYELKPATQFRKGEDNYYVHYQRSGRIPDGRNTDDEFTPFIFANDTLIEIGWFTLTPSTTGYSTYDDSNYAVGILESLEKINESRKTSSSSSAKQSSRVKTKCFSQTTTGGHTIINCN
tara:strand:- start:124 stop:657 length:534 start_codon:yes stop_codon:yes gene_type:complete